MHMQSADVKWHALTFLAVACALSGRLEDWDGQMLPGQGTCAAAERYLTLQCPCSTGRPVQPACKAPLHHRVLQHSNYPCWTNTFAVWATKYSDFGWKEAESFTAFSCNNVNASNSLLVLTMSKLKAARLVPSFHSKSDYWNAYTCASPVNVVIVPVHSCLEGL